MSVVCQQFSNRIYSEGLFGESGISEICCDAAGISAGIALRVAPKSVKSGDKINCGDVDSY